MAVGAGDRLGGKQAAILTEGDEQHAVEAANAPRTVVGIVIATRVLLPETWADVRAARANRLQSSMNPAIGSALAGIGLTVPVVMPASIVFDLPLVLCTLARRASKGLARAAG